MIKIDIGQFFQRWEGKRINFDGGQYAGQCTAVPKQWAKENGWQIPNGGGKDAIGFKNFTNGYKFIKNTILAVPEVGDIAIFNIGKVGHVGVVWSANLLNLTCIEQNNPVGSPVHLVRHYLYSKCIGFLHHI